MASLASLQQSVSALESELGAAQAAQAALEAQLAAATALVAAKRRQLAAAKRALRERETEALKQLVLAPLFPELASLVFAQLPVDSRLRCREVCRGWRAFLADARHWQVLDLSLSSGVARRTLALLRAASERAQGTLRELDVSGWFNEPVGEGEVEFEDEALLPVLRANAASLLELRTWRRIDCERGYLDTTTSIEEMLAAAPRLRLLECDALLRGEDARGPLPRLLREQQFAPLRLQTLFINAENVQPPPDAQALAAWVATHASLKRLVLYTTGHLAEEGDVRCCVSLLLLFVAGHFRRERGRDLLVAMDAEGEEDVVAKYINTQNPPGRWDIGPHNGTSSLLEESGEIDHDGAQDTMGVMFSSIRRLFPSACSSLTNGQGDAANASELYAGSGPRPSIGFQATPSDLFLVHAVTPGWLSDYVAHRFRMIPDVFVAVPGLFDALLTLYIDDNVRAQMIGSRMFFKGLRLDPRVLTAGQVKTQPLEKHARSNHLRSDVVIYVEASLPSLTRMLAGASLTDLRIHNGNAPLFAGAVVPGFCTALRASRLVSLELNSVRLWESLADGLAVVAACTGHPTLLTLDFQYNDLEHAPGREAIEAALDALQASIPELRLLH